MLEPTFNGNNISQQGNVNWPQLDVPAINNAMTKAALVPVGDERNRPGRRSTSMIAEQAPAIPWIWDKTSPRRSKDVERAMNGYYTTRTSATRRSSRKPDA